MAAEGTRSTSASPDSVAADGTGCANGSPARLFDFNYAQSPPDAERTLTEVAEVLKAYGPRPMRIEGHTDSIASDDYNLKLSERRAQSVQSWLASRGGVKAAFATKGWGEAKPVATNDTAAGRQQNRRVEVIIEKGG